MSGFGNLIAEAILEGRDSKAAKEAERKIACKLAASIRVLCPCGNVLDERTVCVLERVREEGSNSTVLVACPTCKPLMDKEIRRMITEKDKLTEEGSFLWLSWDAQEPVAVSAVESDVEGEDHEAV